MKKTKYQKKVESEFKDIPPRCGKCKGKLEYAYHGNGSCTKCKALFFGAFVHFD